MSNSSHFKLYLKNGLSQNLFILLVAALIGFSVNWFRPDGISMIGDWSTEGRVTDDTGVSLVIPLSEAKTLYKYNKALFLDARSKELFEEGHIKRAKNLPWHEVDDYFHRCTSSGCLGRKDIKDNSFGYEKRHFHPEWEKYLSTINVIESCRHVLRY